MSYNQNKYTKNPNLTKFGAALVQIVQPVHTVRSIKYLEIEKSIVDHFDRNLQKIKQKKLIEQQTARDDFWAKRDAERNS